jgi:hypothetical protein
VLTEKLQSLVDDMAKLPPEQREKMAEQIADILDEASWDAQFADQHSEAFFDELVAEAEQGPLRPFPTPTDMGD